MKKFLSVLLSVVMLFSITAGIDLSAYASGTPENYIINNLGSTSSGRITPEQTMGYIQFTLESSGRLNMTITANFEDESGFVSGADYYIYDEDGVKMAERSLSVNNHYEYIYDENQFIDLVAGTYYFGIQPWWDDAFGTFSLKTEFVPSNESFAETSFDNNNATGRADSIELKKTYKGHIAWNDNVDYYKFTVTAGHYNIYLKSLFLDIDDFAGRCEASICTSAGNEIDYFENYQNGTGYFENTESIYLPAATYYLKIKSYFPDCTGNYSFSITPKSHNTVTTKTKATFTSNGKITKTCTECNNVISSSTIYKVSNIKLSATSYIYDGKVKTPTVTVKDSKGNTLKKNTDYSVSYASGRKNVGRYAVKITLKGNYSGSKTLYFTIKPKATSISKLTAKSKGFTVKWKKQASQTTGYQIQYSTSSKFSNAKTVTVSKNSTTSKTVSKLKAKKKYYVRIRTYKTVGKTKYYSAWSKSKSITTKK